ncbi:hypothetical protein EV363DRAFT_826834 [Boletus edulis]|nr:hypothetical protein EV363DRAFT_826834 [Boletus edulis]
MHWQYLPLMFFATSLFALVASAPLHDSDISPEPALTLGSTGLVAQRRCRGYGRLCDGPAGTRSSCCAPLLCVPLSAHKTPYLVCA